ncbi:hypothetical protein ACU4GD_30840 [Cupriavidus basilensis]
MTHASAQCETAPADKHPPDLDCTRLAALLHGQGLIERPSLTAAERLAGGQSIHLSDLVRRAAICTAHKPRQAVVVRPCH